MKLRSVHVVYVLSLVLLAPVARPQIPKDKGYLVKEIRDGLYWLTDGAYGTIFLVYSKGVIAVDPLPADSETYLRDNCWAMIEAQIVQLPPRQ